MNFSKGSDHRQIARCIRRRNLTFSRQRIRDRGVTPCGKTLSRFCQCLVKTRTCIVRPGRQSLRIEVCTLL